jgi:hypothetical protein
MTSAGPSDSGPGGFGFGKLKNKLKNLDSDMLKNPMNDIREKFRDSSLYDVKVGLVHKK